MSFLRSVASVECSYGPNNGYHWLNPAVIANTAPVDKTVKVGYCRGGMSETCFPLSSKAMFGFQHISKHMIWNYWGNTFRLVIVFVDIIWFWRLQPLS
jgi:hypothetical protein